MNPLLSADGKASGTKTWFTIASAVILSKYALAGAVIWGHDFGPFDAQGASMLLAVFGTTYVARQNVTVGKNVPAK